MPKIDIESMEWTGGCSYPPLLDEIAKGRFRKRLGDVVGLDQFGVNLTKLEPGSGSALRHWHEEQDEFVYIVSGEVVLVEDEGEFILKPGDAAAFKANVPNGHHLVNRSGADAVYLEIGTRSPQERGHYPDNDLAYISDENGDRFTRKNGEAY